MYYSYKSPAEAALLLATAALTLSGSVSAALDPVHSKGTKFFYENGTQFYIKGVAYQQDTSASGGVTTTDTFRDPLADLAKCERDIPLLAALGTNAIRTYAIDPTKDHSGCMQLLDAAGIYVISDLGEPRLSINRETPQWDIDLFDRYKAVVDELAQYSNVIGFFAGNEVTNQRNNTAASAYVKAAVRDTKAHIKASNYRPMGVGYAANDDSDIRVDIAHYFNCGDPDDAIDFWGYNIYSWCYESNFKDSGYEAQVQFFSNYSVPVFFAEYGCSQKPQGVEGRLFQETGALYSDQMTDVFSGGIVYMYFQEANDYGLVTIGAGEQASTMKNYNSLKTAVASVAPSSTSADAYTPTNSPQPCPGISDTWKVNGNALPPTPDASLCDCMFKSLSCVPAANLDVDSYSDVFDFICAADGNLCSAINGKPELGVYGAYSMCGAKEKLGAVLDAYYKDQDKASSACDFDGKATVQSPASSSASDCAAKLQSASSINAAAATATAPVTGSDDEDAGIPGAQIARVFSVGGVAVAAYMLVAMGVGAGMVLL